MVKIRFVLPVQGVQIKFLVWDLRSHMLPGMARQKINKCLGRGYSTNQGVGREVGQQEGEVCVKI